MKRYIVATFLASACITPTLAEEAKLSIPTMAIKGEGVHSVKPDYATFSFIIRTRNVNADKAMSIHADKITKVANVLEALKTEGVETESANFNQSVEQKMEKISVAGIPGRTIDKPIGSPEYVLQTDYRLKTRKLDVASLNKVAGNLANGDLYDFGGLQFYADDSRKAFLEARKNAVQDAREQAEAYAEAANIKLVEIAEITDADASDYRRGGEYGVADLPSRRATSGKWLKVSQIIPPEKLNFNAAVNIMWRIGPKN